MFSRPRYLTQGVIAEIPLDLQLFMWSLVDGLESQGIKPDYLQVFKLRPAPDKKMQELEHIQEIPPYSCKYTLPLDDPVTSKVFIIDDGPSHTTMLLASEY